MGATAELIKKGDDIFIIMQKITLSDVIKLEPRAFLSIPCLDPVTTFHRLGAASSIFLSKLLDLKLGQLLVKLLTNFSQVSPFLDSCNHSIIQFFDIIVIIVIRFEGIQDFLEQERADLIYARGVPKHKVWQSELAKILIKTFRL